MRAFTFVCDGMAFTDCVSGYLRALCAGVQAQLQRLAVPIRVRRTAHPQRTHHKNSNMRTWFRKHSVRQERMENQPCSPLRLTSPPEWAN